MTEKIQVQVKNPALAAVLGVPADSVVDVECKNGVPINREWRNRFRDMAIDHCIEPVAKSAKKENK